MPRHRHAIIPLAVLLLLGACESTTTTSSPTVQEASSNSSPYDDEFPPLGGFGMSASTKITRDDEVMRSEVTQFYSGVRCVEDYSKASGTRVTRTWDRSHVLRTITTSWDSNDVLLEVTLDSKGNMRSCGSYRATATGGFTMLSRCGFWECRDRNGQVVPEVSGFYEDSDQIARLDENAPNDGNVDYGPLLRKRKGVEAK